MFGEKKNSTNQKKAYERLTKQSDKMVKLSNKKFPALDVETSVKIQITAVDRCKGDPKNMIVIVMERIADELYKIDTKKEVLATLYSRNQVHPCKHAFIDKESVRNEPINVRSLNKIQSKFGGQGFIKCDCKLDCKSDRCQCKKNNVKYNSKCHRQSNKCKNK